MSNMPPESDTQTLDEPAIASWEWVFADNSLALSEGMCTILQIPPRDERIGFDDFIHYVHPEDRKDLRNAIFQAYRAGKPFSDHFRIIDTENQIRLLKSSGRLITDKESNNLSLFCTVEEIAEKTPDSISTEQPYFLQLLYDRLADGFLITDLNGNLLDVNNACCQILEKSREELLLKNLRDLQSAENTDLEKNLKITIDTGEHLFKLLHPTHQGETLILEMKGSLSDHNNHHVLAFFVQDVTEHTHNKDEIKRENMKLKLLLDSAGDGIYAVNKYGNCSFINRSAQEKLGYSRQQVLGKNMFELIHLNRGHDLTQEPTDYISQVLTTGRPVRLEETEIWRKDSRSFPADLSSHPLVENGQLVGAIVVFRDITKQHSLAMQLEYQASHDTLTGLINRSELLIRINRALASAKQEGRSHTLLFLDLDQFKIINDNSGHAAGDELLRNIANKFKPLIRRGDSLARLGGDEFGILLLNCELHVGEKIAEKFHQLIKDYKFFWEGEKYQLGASIGVVPITSESQTASTVLSAGDTACYSAKDRGRNQIRVYRPNDTGFLRRRGDMIWLGQINQALKENRFHLYYQELRPLQQEEPGIHIEVLVKMDDIEGNRINPGNFLPAAERANLTPEIDRWVIRNTFDWMDRNKDHLEHLDSASINLSGHSLSDKTFLEFVVHEFEQRQLPRGKICFEITETVAIANLMQAQELFSALSHIGCKFSLDDFGTGMSSYGYLKNLPVDYVKIDGIFVKDIIDDTIDSKLVQSITDIAHAMKIKTIAEFVENEAIYERVKSIGVDYAQGYHVGKAEPLDELKLGD